MTEQTTRIEHRSGGSNLWATPRDFAANVVVSLRLPWIALDLAAEPSTTVAPHWYGPGGTRLDALRGPAWQTPQGTRWLNPPYSRQCETCPDRVWRKRGEPGGGCAERGHASTSIDHWTAMAGVEGSRDAALHSPIVALVPASTGTAWWHAAMVTVAEVYLVQGRLKFLAPGADGTLAPAGAGAAFDSAVLVWLGPRGGVPPRFGSLTSAGRLPALPWHGHGREVAA